MTAPPSQGPGQGAAQTNPPSTTVAIPQLTTTNQTSNVTTSTVTITTGYPPVDTSSAIVTAAIIGGAGAIITGLAAAIIGLLTFRVARRTAVSADKNADAAETSAKAANDAVAIAEYNKRTAEANSRAALTSAAAAAKSASAANDSAAAATRQAASSERTAQAAETSAQAAQDAVGVSYENAINVAKRAEADAVAKRYHDSANQLGSTQAPIRLAGAYALGRLADDWPDQRQQCVDVLCAYLRMRWSGQEDDPDSQVRNTIIAIFRNHLTTDASESWSSLRFDFSGAVFTALDLQGASFQSMVDFTACSFLVYADMRDCRFLAGADFAGSTIQGTVIIEPAMILGACSFFAARIHPHGSLSIRDRQARIDSISLSHMEILGKTQIHLGFHRGEDSVAAAVLMDDVRVEGTIVVEIEHASNLTLSAERWQSTANASGRVLSPNGSGTCPALGSFTWDLHWSGA